tara:strand:+ start:279 stop:1559 length:1281 start_codon:yes stop_codon:yes gene_type:complete
VFLVSVGCSSEAEISDSDSGENKNPNILLIIADDMGLDASPGYSIGATKPSMPNLKSLIDSGIKFNNFWSNPVCSPTRSSILTGKYGFRTGVLSAGDNLSSSESSIYNFLNNNASEYSHALIGKWHLSNNPNQPTDMGVDYFAGLLSGGVTSYYNWNLTQNGQTAKTSSYATSKFTDLAINWAAAQSQPWFLWLAYNAPHTPFHLPPSELHSQGPLPEDNASVEANPLPYYMAMIEAMDSEIGRLLNSFSKEALDNTVIIFIGDNGSPNEVVQTYNGRRAKGSIYQGGINVPLIVSGKNVSRINSSEEALVNGTDLFATILDLAGTGISEKNDSKSFKDLLSTSNSPKRKFVYSEKYNPITLGHDYTIRNETHKYLYFNDGTEALYDLSYNPLEFPNLLSPNQLPLNAINGAAKNELVLQLGIIRN